MLGLALEIRASGSIFEQRHEDCFKTQAMKSSSGDLFRGLSMCPIFRSSILSIDSPWGADSIRGRVTARNTHGCDGVFVAVT